MECLNEKSVHNKIGGGGINLFSNACIIHLTLVNEIYKKGFIYFFRSVQTQKQ